MPVVVDCSIAGAWVFPDETSATAMHALIRATAEGMTAPSHFAYEFRNLLIVAERRLRVEAGYAETALAKVMALEPLLDFSFSDVDILQLARKHRLTVYDAAYLELSIRSGSPIATLDRKLATAAVVEGVPVLAAN